MATDSRNQHRVKAAPVFDTPGKDKRRACQALRLGLNEEGHTPLSCSISLFQPRNEELKTHVIAQHTAVKLVGKGAVVNGFTDETPYPAWALSVRNESGLQPLSHEVNTVRNKSSLHAFGIVLASFVGALPGERDPTFEN